VTDDKPTQKEIKKTRLTTANGNEVDGWTIGEQSSSQELPEWARALRDLKNNLEFKNAGRN